METLKSFRGDEMQEGGRIPTPALYQGGGKETERERRGFDEGFCLTWGLALQGMNERMIDFEFFSLGRGESTHKKKVEGEGGGGGGGGGGPW